MEGLDVGQLKHLVVQPALAALGLGGTAAVNLLTGTALAESRGAYVKQIGGGPALGLWQMEPATHDDCWANFLRFPVGQPYAGILENMLAHDLPRSAQMVSNLRYACAMARIRFYRVREALPSAQDPFALSRYHKVHYNTPLGAADPMANVDYFRRAVQA
ncbi:hypothetical protein [Gluconobacter cerinus]|uniref:Uncharacterized protein n=1 Tax=Gluconobacter cerinus TaxID=38307 RepID=A0AAV5NGI0_9PROT|nr:hypothetical protein [Gluconobacter cerinus]GBR00924.1 hypothetical protein AA0229_1315 [Gluconobacter cerinus NRIC 0229]GLQ63524.1 hypothetical protein GCM10007867_23690 [Gluconobacter cerinus]